MSLFSREEQINNLNPLKEWDITIIGGGATGLGIAVDSASRGFKTILLEQSDFAKGTSSRSTKLVHGGVRYLAQGNIDLVKEALYERGLMLKNASHIVHKQSFLIPNYTWWDQLFYLVGLKIYDFLAGKLSFGKSTRISKDQTTARLQTIKNTKLKGAVVYYDGQFDDARLAINLAQTAIENSATVLNYFKVNSLLKNSEDTINGLEAEDVESGVKHIIKSKIIINATGVFTDDILKMDHKSDEKSIIPSQGVHLVLDKSFLPQKDAVMIPKTTDGRVLFLVPWNGKVLVGTTDTPIKNQSLEPVALESEVNFILETANAYLAKKAHREDVLSVFAGLRPLAAPKDTSEKSREISRSHKILISTSGLITIVGGKWTTYRKMAQDTLNKVIQLNLLPKRKCITKNLPIHGSNGLLAGEGHFKLYGSDIKGITELIESNPKLARLLHSKFEFTEAEVVWAIRNEMARTVEDILARRVRLLFLDAQAAIEAAPVVAKILMEELGKDQDWKCQQISQFENLANNYMIRPILVPV